MRTFGVIFLIVAIAAVCVSGLSECERKRANTLRNQQHPKGGQSNFETNALVVECNSDGTYKSLQCYPESKHGRFCMCFDPEGQVVSQPSKKIKKCDCLLDRYKSTQRGRNPPACNEDGSAK